MPRSDRARLMDLVKFSGVVLVSRRSEDKVSMLANIMSQRNAMERTEDQPSEPCRF